MNVKNLIKSSFFILILATSSAQAWWGWGWGGWGGWPYWGWANPWFGWSYPGYYSGGYAEAYRREVQRGDKLQRELDELRGNKSSHDDGWTRRESSGEYR